MARKTLIKRARAEQTVNAHNCQANSKHRLERGDRRLAIWKGRGRENYCESCAKEIVGRDIEKLRELAKQLDGSAPIPQPEEVRRR